MKWIRTCQSCGNKQEASKPDNSKPLPSSYTEAKCKRCKSIDLDYGSYQEDK